MKYDIDDLRTRAQAATTELTGRPIGGGFLERGRAYRGGCEGDWAFCVGVQKPSYARLLDAAAAFRIKEGKRQAVALLSRPDTEPHRLAVPNDAYVDRFRAAAWHGLGVLWLTTEDRGCVEIQKLTAFADWGEICEGVRSMVDSNRGRLKGVRKSREAEAVLRPLVGGVLKTFRFSEDDARFKSFWRTGVADGAWKRLDEPLTRVALEVKVDEDIEAPFGQIIDDLGAFDAVVQVRVLTDSKRLEKVKTLGLDEITRKVCSELPVDIIKLEAF